MAGRQVAARTPPAPGDTPAALREREHAIRNDLFALTMGTNRVSAEGARRREELERQLALTRELLARSEARVTRTHDRERAT